MREGWIWVRKVGMPQIVARGMKRGMRSNGILDSCLKRIPMPQKRSDLKFT
jgi:hypothetical protein